MSQKSSPRQAGQIPIWILVVVIIAAILTGTHYFKNLPVPTQSPQPTLNSARIWKTFTDAENGYSIQYPTDKFTNCTSPKEFFLFEGVEGIKECGAGEERTEFLITHSKQGTGNFEKSEFEQCYTVLKEPIIVDGVKGNKYSNILKSDKGKCDNQEVHYAKNSVHIILEHGGKLYNIHFFDDIEKDIKYKILSTFKFLSPPFP